MADPNARDTKLIQYLNEAYGKEKELETALQAHIAMTTKAPYKKRLQEHLRETKGHARDVKRRIKELGGKAEAGPISSGPDVVVEAATGITAVASKAVAAAQGPAARDPRDGHGGEDAEERPHRVPQRVRGDRLLRGYRVARRDGRRQGHREARALHPARGGADGEVPREADRAAREGGRPRGDPGGRAPQRRKLPPAVELERTPLVEQLTRAPRTGGRPARRARRAAARRPSRGAARASRSVRARASRVDESGDRSSSSGRSRRGPAAAGPRPRRGRARADLRGPSAGAAGGRASFFA